MSPAHQKTGIIKVAAVSTVVQAALGIAVVSLLYSRIPVDSASNEEYTTPNPDGNLTNTTTVQVTTPTATTPTATTPANSTNETTTHKPEESEEDFLQFFDGIIIKTTTYAETIEVRSALGVAFIINIFWLISVASLIVSVSHSMVSPLRHQCLLPWLIITIVVCIMDVCGTVFFVFKLMDNENIDKELGDSIRTIVQYLFLQFYFSKAGIFWLLNVTFIVIIAQSYSYWKEIYTGEDLDDTSLNNNGVELAPYDGSVRRKPYDIGNQPDYQYNDDGDDDDDKISDYGYTNGGYENTPDEKRYTSNPLHERYQPEPRNRYEQPNQGGDFRRFSAVDDYNASPTPRPSTGAERFPEHRNQNRRESQLSHISGEPYRKPSQAKIDPYRRPSREPQSDKRSGVPVPSAYGPQTSPIPEEDFGDYSRQPPPDLRQHYPQDRERSYYQQKQPVNRNDSWNQSNPSDRRGPSTVDRYTEPWNQPNPSERRGPFTADRAPRNQPNPSERRGPSPGERYSEPQSRPPYYQNPVHRPEQTPVTKPPDKHSKPEKQQQRPQPQSRRDEEFPIRASLFAGPPPASNARSRQPSFTYLPQIHADQPYNIPRINLK